MNQPFEVDLTDGVLFIVTVLILTLCLFSLGWATND